MFSGPFKLQFLFLITAILVGYLFSFELMVPHAELVLFFSYISIIM